MNNTFYYENNLCGLKRTDFQKNIGGKETDLFILTNDNGAEMAITNYGGAILAIMVPDKNCCQLFCIKNITHSKKVLCIFIPFFFFLIYIYSIIAVKVDFLRLLPLFFVFVLELFRLIFYLFFQLIHHSLISFL